MSEWTPELPQRGKAKYLLIADALARDIGDGRLEPGAQLPTHRDLADRLGVTVGTVSRAYAVARAGGLITGEVGRGTFVAERGVTERPLKRERSRPGTAEMSINEPLYAFTPDLSRALHALAARGGLETLMRYEEPLGRWAHRDAGAVWARTQGIPAEPSQVVVTSGAQHAIFSTLSALCVAGDRVLVPRLSYPGLQAVATMLGLQLVGLPFDRDGVEPDALDAVCRSSAAKVLYLNPTVHNPTALVMSQRRREQLAEIARRAGLWILEDNTYRFLVEDAPDSFAALIPELTCAIASVSKAVSGGLRVAFLVAPHGLLPALAHRVWASLWMTAPLMAELAATWIADGTAMQTALAKRAEARRRQAVVRPIVAPLEVWGHPSALHLWLPLPAPLRSARVVADLRTRGVAVSDGQEFAMSREATPEGLRVCLGAAQTDEELRRGATVIRDALRSPGVSGVRL